MILKAHLFLYNFLFPANHVTELQVNSAIANAMASATPRAAFSVDVYRIIQPSLVLIQVELKDGEKGLGSGVIIDDAGDILTSLHVVDGAAKISIVFGYLVFNNQMVPEGIPSQV